eukprot:UN08439
MLVARFLPAIFKASWEQDKWLTATKDEISKMKLDSRSSDTLYYSHIEPFMMPYFKHKECIKKK